MSAARDDENAGRMSNRALTLAAVLWPSFLSSCVATVLFFAAVDPDALADASPLLAPLDRETGYAIGFFFFWLIAAIASALSVYLVRGAAARTVSR